MVAHREIHFAFATVSNREIVEFRRRVRESMKGAFPAVTGQAIEELHGECRRKLHAKEVVSFNSGRQAFYAILEALQVGPGDEVIVPGYTCVVVPAAVLYRGARPVYADIDPRTFGPDPVDVARRVSPRTKVILAQHTYGIPCDAEALRRIADENKVALVEDCAHVFGRADDDGRSPGSWGDASFYSFEITKPITAGRGGLAVTNDAECAMRLRAVYDRTSPPRLRVARWDAIQALAYHAALSPKARFLGGPAVGLLTRLGVFEPSITRKELHLRRPRRYPERLSNLQASLALSQVRRVDEIRAARVAATKHYRAIFTRLGLPILVPRRDLALLRWPFLLTSRKAAKTFFWKYQIELGEWFNAPLHPGRSDHHSAGYLEGMCRRGEFAARHASSFPTHPAVLATDFERIDRALEAFAARHPSDFLPGLEPGEGA